MQHGNQSIKGKRILLAEDCDDSREILKFLFTKSGARVEAVSTGLECVDLALNALSNKMPFDLVILDVHMPILDGNGATKKLRANGYNLPIVAITGQVTEEEKNACMSSGCNAFMSKLTSKDNMLKVLEGLLPPEEVDNSIPALPFIPQLITTDPEYAPLILKFIDSLEGKFEQMIEAVEQQSWKNLLEICGSLSSSSLYGYQIFAERLADLEGVVENKKFEEISHHLRLLKQSAKSIILGKREIEKIVKQLQLNH